MQLPLNLLLFLVVLLPFFSDAQPKLPPLTDSIDSKILGETRGIQVIMPRDYQTTPGKRYEIVYILDGEWYYELVPNTFNFAQSAEYTPKHIFVLIRNKYNDGRNMRDRDFSPTRLEQDSITGGADRFYDFVRNEVVPYIEKKYPANGQRTLVGSSFSGLFCVYSFVKDPSFFNSFVASDPSISWDDSYVTSKMADRLKDLPSHPGTLFVAGLTQSYRFMGIEGLDSVLRNYAPKSLHWKCIPYENESHYSVQLKAFYDGARFSHLGFSTRPPEFHPMQGMLSSEARFPIFFLNLSPLVRYTIDGSEPNSTSPLMVRMQSANIKAPATLRVQSFGNRPIYTQNWSANFRQGTMKPKQRNIGRDQLKYAVYQPSGPAESDRKLVKSGTVDSTFKMGSIDVPNAIIVLNGSLNIPEDGTYVFFCDGYKKMRLKLEGVTLFEIDSATLYPSQSYVVSLVKGNFAMELELTRDAEHQPNLKIFKSAPPDEKWWARHWKHF